MNKQNKMSPIFYKSKANKQNILLSDSSKLRLNDKRKRLKVKG